MLPVLLVLMLGVSSSLQAAEIITVEDNNEHELVIDTQSTKEYLINLPYSFKLLVKIEEVDVQSKYGDYLLIKRGPDLETEGTGIVLTEKGIPKNTLFISANTVYIQFFVGDDEPSQGQKIRRKCKLKYTASGSSKLTTTEAPISTSPWPTPGPNDKVHYKAHLYGLKDTDYNLAGNVYMLRVAIANMADAYCKDQAMPVAEKIRPKNVLISDLIRCPYSWPDSEKCVIVNFAVPVVMKEYYKGYELLAKHLEIMWTRYDEYLQKYGFENYKIPDLDTELVLWDATFIVLLTLLVFAIIAIALIVVCKPRCIARLFRSANKAEDRHIIVNQEDRDSYVPNESEYDRFKASAIIT